MYRRVHILFAIEFSQQRGLQKKKNAKRQTSIRQVRYIGKNDIYLLQFMVAGDQPAVTTTATTSATTTDNISCLRKPSNTLSLFVASLRPAVYSIHFYPKLIQQQIYTFNTVVWHSCVVCLHVFYAASSDTDRRVGTKFARTYNIFSHRRHTRTHTHTHAYTYTLYSFPLYLLPRFLSPITLLRQPLRFLLLSLRVPLQSRSTPRTKNVYYQ